MAKTLSKTGITTGNTVQPGHVTQSVDAFTGIEAYDISLSGSLNMTGSINGEPGVTNNLTASYAITSSHALTASYAENAGASFPYTGSAEISGSLTVDGNISGSLIMGTTRTTKEHNYLDNTSVIDTTLNALNIYAGSITSLNLGESGDNTIKLQLPDLIDTQIGDRYEFIIVKNQGISEGFTLQCSGSDEIVGNIIGCDNVNQYSSGDLSLYTGDGNGLPGDTITATSAGTDSDQIWIISAIVSGSSGYGFSS